VVAEHYGDLLEGYVFDEIDSNQLHDIESMDIKPFITDTFMKTIKDRKRLAEEVILFGETILG
jgi:hypothetical protein